MARKGDAQGVLHLENIPQQQGQAACIRIGTRRNVPARLDEQDFLPDAVQLVGGAYRLLDLVMLRPLLGAHVSPVPGLQGLVIRGELALRIPVTAIIGQIGVDIPDRDGERVIREIGERLREGGGRCRETGETGEESGRLLRTLRGAREDDVLVVGFVNDQGGPVRQGADKIRLLADAGRGPYLEQFRNLPGGEEGDGTAAGPCRQLLKPGGFKDADPFIQVTAGRSQERFRTGGQQEAILYGGLEPRPFRPGGGMRERGGVELLEFRDDERNERAAVVQGHEHPVLAGPDKILLQRRVAGAQEGAQHARGIREHRPGLRRPVEAEYRGSIGRNGPQEGILCLLRGLPGLVAAIEFRHRPGDAGKHQRDGDDRYDG